MAAPPIRSPSASPTGSNALLPISVVSSGARGGRGRARNRSFGPRYGPRSRPALIHHIVPNEFDMDDDAGSDRSTQINIHGHRLNGSENSSFATIDNEKLKYEIIRYSSYCTNYLP